VKTRFIIPIFFFPSPLKDQEKILESAPLSIVRRACTNISFVVPNYQINFHILLLGYWKLFN